MDPYRQCLHGPRRNAAVLDVGATIATTTDYDPRYDRAQTLEGAKARYVENGNDYGIHALEADVERLLLRTDTDR